MAGFTKGPWQADDLFTEGGRRTRVALPDIFSTPNETICECLVSDQYDSASEGTHFIGVVEAEANARAIAALPDLYAALKQIVFDWDGEPEDMAAAREAIAKAEGRSE